MRETHWTLIDKIFLHVLGSLPLVGSVGSWVAPALAAGGYIVYQGTV